MLAKTQLLSRRDTHCQNVYRKSSETLMKPVRSEGLYRQGRKHGAPLMVMATRQLR